MYLLKSAFLYFLIVFGAGFILGTVRTLFVVPRIGTRRAELLETPLMIVIIFLSARWIVGQFVLPLTLTSRLGMGCIALCFMLIAEFTLVLRLRRMSLAEYFASRDPVSGTVYKSCKQKTQGLPVTLASLGMNAYDYLEKFRRNFRD